MTAGARDWLIDLKIVSTRPGASAGAANFDSGLGDLGNKTGGESDQIGEEYEGGEM